MADIRNYYRRKRTLNIKIYLLGSVAVVMVIMALITLRDALWKYSTETTLSQVPEVEQELLLVNKDNKVSSDYEPEDLVPLETDFISNGDRSVNVLKSEAASALKEMFEGAEKDGVYLLGVSGYRDYNYQKRLYENEVQVFGEKRASRYVAEPGESEHQTGLAIDILSSEYQIMDENFKFTNAYKWIEDNCEKYGFIIRYPEGKEDVTGYGYEPWHIRYVGVNAAEYIMNNDLTLEEYLNK